MELPPLLTAKENPAVKQYRKLARLKKERMAQRKFVLEGVRLVTDACANGARLSHLMVTQDAWEQHAADWAQLDSRQTKISLLSDALAAQMGETEHPQGVFAICEMPEVIPLEKLLQTGNSYLLLHQVQDPGNLGMMLRTADALGIAAVICSQSCDWYAPKVVRATMGSLFRVPVLQVPAIEPVLQACRMQGVETCAAVVRQPAEWVGQATFSGRTAVLIGNEGNGLPEEVANACARRITIPMHGLSLSMPPWLPALFYGNWYGINRTHRGGIKDGSASILAVADYGARNWQSIDLEIDGAAGYTQSSLCCVTDGNDAAGACLAGSDAPKDSTDWDGTVPGCFKGMLGSKHPGNLLWSR